MPSISGTNQLFLRRALSWRRCAAWLLVFMCLVGLTACGKRPGHVDPPVGAAKQTFPRTYPDPETDPAP